MCKGVGVAPRESGCLGVSWLPGCKHASYQSLKSKGGTSEEELLRCERERCGWRAACNVNQTQKRTAFFVKRFVAEGRDILDDEAFESAVERARVDAIGTVFVEH